MFTKLGIHERLPLRKAAQKSLRDPANVFLLGNAEAVVVRMCVWSLQAGKQSYNFKTLKLRKNKKHFPSVSEQLY